ncbi:MAG TPA: hypothetical protein VMS55_24245 [Myxococcota bacterium]|nr:hypothetical protein [Myxococcota bacterium]
MRLRHAFLGSASAVLFVLGLAAGSALADDNPPPMPGAAWCKENPGKCKEARAKHEQWCKDNPKQCEQWKQKRAERQEFCKNNPKKCEEERAAMKKRMQEVQAECAKDPAKCEQTKQQMRERMQERHGAGMGATPAKKVEPAPEAPAEPPGGAANP